MKPEPVLRDVVEEQQFEESTVLSPRDAELLEAEVVAIEDAPADEVVEAEVEPAAPVEQPEVEAELREMVEEEPVVVVAVEVAEPAVVEPELVAETVVVVPPAAVKKTPARKPAARKPAARKPSAPRIPKTAAVEKSNVPIVLSVRGLTKTFDDKVAVSGLNLEVEVGAFYGIVGPNGAGKTTTLSMITGLLRPDSGTITVNGSDVWKDTVQAKRMMGVLPDRLRLFDRLTGGQLLYYAGVLRGLDGAVVRERTADLAHAFGLEESLGRLVSDYSAGMTKKIALAAAMIHSPRLLVLDEPFESVDPVSAATVTEILKKYVTAGGTVVLSSHSMDLVQRICDHVAVVVNGEVLADGTMASVRNGETLEERFVDLAGGRTSVEGLEWLHSFSA